MLILLIILKLIYKVKSFNCDNNSPISCYNNIINTYGELNIVFGFKFLQGFSNLSQPDPLEALKDRDAVFRKPIILVGPYKEFDNLESRAYMVDTHQTIELKNYFQYVSKITLEIGSGEKCAENKKIFVWLVKVRKKVCIFLYACHIKTSRKSIYTLTKKVIVMVEETRKFDEIESLDINKNEFEGNFSKFQNIQGERFCMCENILKEIKQNAQEKVDKFSPELEWSIIVFFFMLIIFILYLIYECLMKEKSERKKPTTTNIILVTST
jgi:hypothetical protein